MIPGVNHYYFVISMIRNVVVDYTFSLLPMLLSNHSNLVEVNL